jgi:hypothetical protein
MDLYRLDGRVQLLGECRGLFLSHALHQVGMGDTAMGHGLLYDFFLGGAGGGEIAIDSEILAGKLFHFFSFGWKNDGKTRTRILPLKLDYICLIQILGIQNDGEILTLVLLTNYGRKTFLL